MEHNPQVHSTSGGGGEASSFKTMTPLMYGFPRRNSGKHQQHQSSLPVPFFSPPAADLTFFNRRRPTPYDSTTKSIGSPLNPLSRTIDNLSGNHHTPSSVSSNSQDSGALAAQVQDLNQLLTSPLVVHLGELADNNANPLGQMTDDKDDMSEEWGSVHAAERTPDSIPGGSNIRLCRSRFDPFRRSTPTAARHFRLSGSPRFASSSHCSPTPRLDPMSSPLHPFNSSPKGRAMSNLDGTPAMSLARSYANKLEESDQYVRTSRLC